MVKNNKKQIVVGYHPIANRVGEKILDFGGNAFDTFVATTFAEFVLGEGVTSLAGPLSALLYDSKSKKCYYLDASFNTPIKNNKKDKTGARVPGAPAGLEAISKKFGKLSFEEVIKPAIQLARKGFKLNDWYSYAILSNKEKLKKSEYGKQKFFQNGKPLSKGQILKFPKVANVLKSLAKEGSRYMYEGEWAKKAVKIIQENGGILILEDFKKYKPNWKNPLKTKYREHEVYSPSGRTYGGLAVLLAIKSLENIDSNYFKEHYSDNDDALELLIRINNEAEKVVYNLMTLKKLDNLSFIQNSINKLAKEIWEKVKRKIKFDSKFIKGNHSYQISVVDNEGNAITGTNSIQSLQWGEGIFVEGVPLTASGKLMPFYSTSPGERELSSLSMHIGIKNNEVSFISGAFNASLLQAEFQFLVNIIDYKLSVKKVTNLPRFGMMSSDIKNKKYFEQGIWLDKRIKKPIIKTLNKRGFKFNQKDWVDTGLGSVIIVKPNGLVEGSIAPV